MSDPKVNDGDGIAALSYILAGLILYGFLGWLGDRWLGTSFLLPLGLILGLALGVFLIIKRYGAQT
jgi:F0F1-type ATP synthase assembly protein I